MENNNAQRPITEGTEVSPLRTIKDSVFRDLFGNPEYLLHLRPCHGLMAAPRVRRIKLSV